MVDFNKNIKFVVLGKTYTCSISPNLEVLRETTAERGDENYQFFAKVKLSDLK